MANMAIVREREVNPEENSRKLQSGARGAIVSEVMGLVNTWRKWRDDEFEDLWDEFYAKWRGFWSPSHKSYKMERSKLTAPLTQMAVDLTVAEIIEALFGREYFIDLPDDIDDEEKADVERVRNLLVQDLRNGDFIQQMALTVLCGSLYGTGVMKIGISTKYETVMTRDSKGEIKPVSREVVDIRPVAIEPGQFVADPAATNVDDMYGCAHEFTTPIHMVTDKQLAGVYYSDVDVQPYNARQLMPNRGNTEEGARKDLGRSCFITEWYGKIPTRLYLAAMAEDSDQDISELLEEIDPRETTEVIATIVNETHLLRVIETPLLTDERLVCAYQHENVMGRFHGRGVCEKGINVQRAMDAEMRGRIDGLAWSNFPMFAGDLTRLPPSQNLNAWPGKFWGTRGNPNEILREFRMSGPDPNTFQHMQDLERMGQQATGALDSIMSLRAGVRDETATGSAMSASGFIKRSKRTMYNIECFMNQLIRRIGRLKMQFEPDRYPVDYDFQVRGSVGIMARELEQQFLVNLLQIVGMDSGASLPMLMAVFEHSGSPAKNDVLAALKAMAEKKPTPEEQAAQQAQLLAPVRQVQKLEAEIEKLLAEAGLKDAQAEKTEEEIDNMDFQEELQAASMFNDLRETSVQEEQLRLMQEKNEIERSKIKAQAKKD